MAGFLKRLREAPDLARLRRRSDQDPSPRSCLQLCRKLQMQGRSADAMEVAREALARFPHSRELQDMLRSAWRRQCREHLEAFYVKLREEPTIECYVALIDHLIAYHELQEAAQWADRMISEFASEREAALVHGRVYDRLFRSDHVAADGAKAIKSFRRAVDISPQAFDAHMLLARIFAYIGAVSKALHHAFKALDVDPDHAEVSALMARLSQLPLEKETEGELLRRVEENDGPPRLGQLNAGACVQAMDPGGEIDKTLKQLSSMAGVKRVVLIHEGFETLAVLGQVIEVTEENRNFVDLTLRFRRTGAISAKRMGIGGLQEAEISWRDGHLLVFAAGPTALLIEAKESPRLRAVANEGRMFIATCTQAEMVPIGGAS